MTSFFYFAYGSNMLTERLVARCPSARPVGTAYAPDYTLEFSKKSTDTSGKATLVPCPGAKQHGVIFEIDQADQAELDHFEGAGNGYDRVDAFTVTAASGTEVSTTTYLATKPVQGLKPFDWYLALVVSGAKRHQLPEDWVSALRLTSYLIDYDNNRKTRLDALDALKKIGITNPTEVLANTVKDLIQSIIVELTRLQGIPAMDINKGEVISLPRMISAGDAGSLFVSRKLDDDIAAVSKMLMDQDPAIKLKFSLPEWQALVRKEFGPVLVSIDLDSAISENVSAVLSGLKAALPKSTDTGGTREIAFGCTLFSSAEVKPFDIGPVRFESRLDWLSRKYGEKGFSAIAHRRIKRAWGGEKLPKRKPSFDSIIENDVLDAIGTCAYVCSVKTENLAAEAAREKALTAARLATTAIALAWQVPSKTLEGINLNYDRRPHRRKVLTYVPGQKVLAGSSWSHPPFGPSITAGDWETELKDRADLFTVVAEILDFVISPTGAVKRPKMMRALAHAMLWFHEGCRETVTHMAVVNFAASLDALANGGKEGGIRRLLNARIGLQDDKPIRKNGPSLKQAVERVYGKGRSRTIHGNNDELGNDWSDVRSLAEQLAKLALVYCMHWVAQNPTCDDPKQLSKP